MTQNFVVAKSTFEKGKGGLAVLTKLSSTTARVDFQEDSQSIPLTLDPSDPKQVPTYFPFAKYTDNSKLNVQITLTKDNVGIDHIHPANSVETVKFLWFANGEKAAPTPKQKPGLNEWGNPHTPSCPVIVEVLEGKWKGCQIWANLSYEFLVGDNGMVGIKRFTKKVTLNQKKLGNFMDAIKVNAGELTPSENLLPEIQKLAQERAAKFSVLIEGGWVNGFNASEEEESFGFIDDAVTPTPVAEDDEIGFLTPAQQANIHPALREVQPDTNREQA